MVQPGSTAAAVDVVVLTWNDGALLDAALSSIEEASATIRPEVIVVDNGSDPPAEVGRPGAVLLRQPTNLGVAAGRNVGVRAGTSELVCLLDSDAQLLAGSLERLVEHLLADPEVGLVAPTFVDQLPEASAGAAPTLRRKVGRLFGRTEVYAGSARAESDVVWDVDFAIGACQVFRRSAYEAVGGIDETYFYGPEDADFCMRLKVAGWRVCQVADAPVLHPPRRRNRKVLTRRGVQHGWAVTRFLWRHRGFDRRTQ